MSRLFTKSVVLFTFAVIVFAGCGGGSGNSGNGKPPVTPPVPQTYTVTFNSNLGSPVQTAIVNSGGTAFKPSDPTRAGYDFEGWYRDSGFANKVIFPIVVTENITLYARWTPVSSQTYFVTFVTNGGSSVAALTGTSISVEPSTSRYGYDFDGWFINPGFSGSRITFPYALTQDITLYAKWKPASLQTYNVTFVTNGGSPVAAMNVSSISVEPSTSRFGYDFDGWFTTSGFSGSRVAFPYDVTQDITLYAKWKPASSQTYTVTFVTNGGSPVAAMNVSSVSVEPYTSRSGYVFDGWFFNPGFSGGRVAFPYNVTEDITWYAKWTPVSSQTYTVTFVTNGGSSVASMNVSSISVEPSTSRSGYDFGGWFLNSGFSGSRVAFPCAVTQNMTLYAKWTSMPVIEEFIEIYTADQLNDIRNNLSGSYKLMSNISLSSYANWVPIGTESAPFRGKIDGNGFKITDLTIRRSLYTGLFGYVRGGTLITLAIEGVGLNYTYVSRSYTYTGSIAGYVSNGTISNSYSTGNISSGTYVGGIAGYVSNGIINNSYNIGDVSSSFDGYSYAGGIAGYTSNSIISNSYSMGNVSSSSSGSYNPYAYAGGITGYVSNDIISNSYNIGNIYASGFSTAFYSSYTLFSSYAGGIAGHVLDNSTIGNSYSMGNVSSSSVANASSGVSPNSSYAGGIAGHVENNNTLKNNYSIGDISSYSSYTSYAGGIAGMVANSAGGIAGGSRSTITNCAALNDRITARNFAGRIAGYVSNDAYTASIFNNFALNTMQSTGAAEFYITNIALYGISKTDVQLKTQTTYSDSVNGDGLGGLGWKFGEDDDNPWIMPTSGGYPILYWQ